MARSKIKRGQLGPTKGNARQVNPPPAASRALATGPASKSQVNPTYAGNKRAQSTATPPKSRINPTYAVTQKSKENSKGTPAAKLVARKSKVTPSSYRATGQKPQSPNRASFSSNSGGADVQAYQTPTRNESAPYGPNARGKVPMTVKRLKKLGY